MDEEMMFEMSAGSLEGLPSVGEMFDLTGKVAVVSGTIGLALSVIYRLASCGAKVVFGARRETVGQMAEERLREMGLDVRFHKLDVSSVESCREIVAFAEQTYGTVDIVVPVAAAFFARAFVDIKESEYDHIVDVDQKGQYFLVQANGGVEVTDVSIENIPQPATVKTCQDAICVFQRAQIALMVQCDAQKAYGLVKQVLESEARLSYTAWKLLLSDGVVAELLAGEPGEFTALYRGKAGAAIRQVMFRMVDYALPA